MGQGIGAASQESLLLQTGSETSQGSWGRSPPSGGQWGGARAKPVERLIGPPDGCLLSVPEVPLVQVHNQENPPSRNQDQWPLTSRLKVDSACSAESGRRALPDCLALAPCSSGQWKRPGHRAEAGVSQVAWN